MRHSQTRAVNLYRIFGCSGKPQLNSRILRLAVLYEDLRLELNGTDPANELRPLDRTGCDYRTFYFIRRAIGTAKEFAEAYRLLDEWPEFADVKSTFSDESRAQWQECVEFFAKEKNTLEAIRNDIGGHFGQPAALYAIGNLVNAGSGMIEFHQDHANEKGGMCFKFAEQIVAAAMSRQKSRNETQKQFFVQIFSLLEEAFRHAVRSTELIGVH